MKHIPDISVPFDDKGNMISYDNAWGTNTTKPNFIFEATMNVANFYRGRSAANLILKDDGHRYRMFTKDMLHMLKTKTIENGRIYGQWTFRKQGANFGLMVYEP
jgi:hypothetical protein